MHNEACARTRVCACLDVSVSVCVPLPVCVCMCAQARVYVRVCVCPFLQNTDNHCVSDLRHQEVRRFMFYLPLLIQIRKEKKHSTTPPLPEPSKPNQTHRPLKEFVVHLTKGFRITRFLVKGESITPKKRHSTAHRTCP